MTSSNGTEAPAPGGLPPIGTAVHLDMNERLTIPIAPAAAEPEEEPHPALNPTDIETIVGSLLNASSDRPVTRAELDRLTAYIAYLERLRCDQCAGPLGYHNYAGRSLCGPCANGAEPDSVVSGRGLRYMEDVADRGGSVSVHDSSNAERDAVWLHIVGGEHVTTVEHDEEKASLELGIHAAVTLAHSLAALVLARGYSLPALLEALTAEPEPEEPAAPAVVGGRYDIGADGALWVERWSAERHYSDQLAAELARVGALHTPYIDEHGRTRCRGCIAGYDTRTGQLTHCAWPCPTERARTGEATA